MTCSSDPPAHANGQADGPIATPSRPQSPQEQFGTRAVHAGAHVDPSTGAVIAPVCSPAEISTSFLVYLR
jgi:cystathionine gamma-lyase